MNKFKKLVIILISILVLETIIIYISYKNDSTHNDNTKNSNTLTIKFIEYKKNIC